MGKRGKNFKEKEVRTTIKLSESLWRKLKIESVKKKKSLSELIESKIRELEKMRKNAS